MDFAEAIHVFMKAEAELRSLKRHLELARAEKELLEKELEAETTARLRLAARLAEEEQKNAELREYIMAMQSRGDAHYLESDSSGEQPMARRPMVWKSGK